MSASASTGDIAATTTDDTASQTNCTQQHSATEQSRATKRNQRKYEKKKEKKKNSERNESMNEEGADLGQHREKEPNGAEELPLPDTLYELQIARGEADRRKNFGLFAVRDIARGTCIISEPALIDLPSKSTGPELFTQFHNLSSKKKAQYLDLSHHFDPLPGPSTDPDTYLVFVPAPKNYKAHIARIWLANKADTPEGGHAVYASSARINHSCTPNVVLSSTPEGSKRFVHAIRDINVGEEIVAAYTDVCCGRADRADALDFSCDCVTCDPKKDGFRKSNNRRAQLMEEKRMLASFTKHLRSPERARVLATSFIENLEKEGLVGEEMAFAYNRAAAIATAMNNRVIALAFKRKELDVVKCCYGEDSAKYKRCAEENQKLEKAKK